MFRHWAFASPPPVIPTGAPDRIRGEVDESRRRRPALVVRAGPRSLHSPESRPGSVGMTDERSGRDGDLRCHEMLFSVMIRCCRAFAVYRPPARTDHSIYHVFLHRRFRPKPHRRPGPPRTAGQHHPPKRQICSFNVPSADVKRFLRRLRPGSGPGIPPAKGQGPRRRPFFRLFRVSQRNPLQRRKCRREAQAMGVWRPIDGKRPVATRGAARRVRRRANPTRPPLPKKGRDNGNNGGALPGRQKAVQNEHLSAASGNVGAPR